MQRDKNLNQRITENDSEITRLRDEKEELIRNKKETEEKKKAEIANLSKSIEQMSQQFSSMLRDTLEKMKERIAAANKAWEDENEKKMIAQAKDFKEST